MQIEYTPEEVRALIEEHEALEYPAATAADVAEATDVLEGIEGLVARLDPAVRREALGRVSIPVADQLWIPVADNCSRSAGVAIASDGSLSFTVWGRGEGLSSYFSARQAVAHALLGQADANANAKADAKADVKVGAAGDAPAVPEIAPEAADANPLVSALKASGWAVAAGRTIADVDAGVLANVYPLSEAGVAHLFSEGGGIVLAMAGSTAGDRRRAVETLPTLPERGYSSRGFSVLFESGEAGAHYSEEPGFGHVLKEAPHSREVELAAAAERFRAARFLRPSQDRPLDVHGIRRRVRQQPLVRAAVRAAVRADRQDAEATYRLVAVAAAVAGLLARGMVGRALAAERPWDTGAERERMEKAGRRLRREMLAGREARDGRPPAVVPATALDAERRERLAACDDPKLRRNVARRLKSGRAAYDTARAVYLQRCPELEHKLLHLLRRDGDGGGVPEREFVSRRRNLAPAAEDPEAAVRGALRSLAEAGKVRRVRSSRTGEVFLAATEPLDETGFRRSLNGLIRDGRFGIVNPWARAGAVETEGEDAEWERGAENLEASELDGLAPRRLRDTTTYERPLPAADLVAEPSAQEEIEAIAESA